MPWNLPGNNPNNNPDPWGGKKKATPPDLDKLIGVLIKKISQLFQWRFTGNLNWKPSQHYYGSGIGVIAVIIVILWLLSGIFIVNPAEEAVVLRFGQYHEMVTPGVHWMARFIDTKYLVDVQKIYSFSLQGDFLTKSSDQNDLPVTYVPIDAAKKITGLLDQSKNLVSVELNVQYRIKDPRAYLFNVVNTDDTIQEVANGALSDVIGQMKLDEVLTTGRESLSLGVLNKVREILNFYQTGLDVVTITLKKVQAPDQVREAFNDVNRADQDKATYIQQAQAYASKVVPLAQGVAARISADANAYQQQVVLSAQAQVARYIAVFNAYRAAPDVTRERLYLETMQNILENSSKILIDTSSGNNVIYLPLDQWMKQNPVPSSSATPEKKNDANP